MSLSSFQSDLKTVLAAVTALSGLEIMLELDEAATAAQLAAQDAVFEREISQKGFVIVLSTPRAERIDSVTGRPTAGAINLRLLCQVAFIENPTVNRAALDVQLPLIVPAGKKPLVLIRAAIQGLLAAGYELPAQPLTSPEQDLDGLNLHGLLVLGRDDIRAS